MALFSIIKRSSPPVPRPAKKRDYHRAQYENPHHRETKQERRGVFVRIVLATFGSVTVLTAVYWMLFSGAFAVTTVAIHGAQRTDAGEVDAYLRVLLQRNRMWLLRQRMSLFLVDTVHMRERLIERFALKNALIIPKLPHALDIIVEERMPAFTVRTPQQRYLIDEDGLLVGEMQEDDPLGSILTVLSVPSIRSTTTGDRLFDASAMKFLSDLEAAYPSITQGYKVKELDLSRVLVHDITVITSEAWVIYMSDTLDPRLQFLNVDRALRDMKEERKKIKYIDVRLPNKIFYK